MNRSKHEHHGGGRKCRHGPSSYWMHNPDTVFEGPGLKVGECFLDLGCGPGEYALRASRLVGDSGIVYALDVWRAMIEDLTDRAASEGVTNIEAVVCDITGPIPVEDSRIDVCLVATVLHIPGVARDEGVLFAEIRRVLKPGGRLAIIECKRDDMPHGPPKNRRLSPENLEVSLARYDFKKVSLIDLGYNYMLLFTTEGRRRGNAVKELRAAGFQNRMKR